jgi:hypothetical protein
MARLRRLRGVSLGCGLRSLHCLRLGPRLMGRSRRLCYWVVGAGVGLKLAIAQLLIVPLHFSDGGAGRHTRRIELPCALRTAPTQEARCFDPYHLPTHSGRLMAGWLRHLDSGVALGVADCNRTKPSKLPRCEALGDLRAKFRAPMRLRGFLQVRQLDAGRSLGRRRLGGGCGFAGGGRCAGVARRCGDARR